MLDHMLRRRKHKAPLTCSRNNCPRHRVLRRLFKSRQELQDFVMGHSVKYLDRNDLRSSVRQRPGFVENQRLDPR